MGLMGLISPAKLIKLNKLIQVSDLARTGWKPKVAHSPGQAKRHPGFPHSRVSAPCKGKSLTPLCCYSCLIADLAVLKWNTVCIFCSILAPCLKAFALTGRDCSNTRYPGCRFACPGLCATLGFQPALAKSETWIRICYIYMVWGIFSVFLFCLLPDCWHSAALLHHSICL